MFPDVTEARKDSEAVKFSEAFSGFVNGSRHSGKRAAALCCREHRTIQQGMMRFCIEFIEQMAHQTTDPRNESAVNFAKIVMDKTSSKDRAMPCV